MRNPDPVEAAAYALAVHGPYRPHAVIGVLGDGSTGTLRLQFTEPATVAEVEHVLDVLSDYVPLTLHVEPRWSQRVAVDIPHPFLGFRLKPGPASH